MNQVLSRLDLLVTDCPEAIREVFDAIKLKTATQQALLARLNAVLAQRGIEPVSSSALNRWAMRVRTGEVRRPAGVAAEASRDSVAALDANSRLAVAKALRTIADALDPAPAP